MNSFHHLLGMCILTAWPIIPLFWIPAHLFHVFFRRHLGLYVYGLAGLLWLPLLWIVWEYGDMALQHVLPVPWPLRAAGWILFCSGLALQIWTAKVMGPVIIGIPEVTQAMKSCHVITPPFNWCRHPTYLSHAMIFSGAALLTGYTALFILAFADMLATHLIIIPFEEKELLKRLGQPYRKYMKQTPKFIPSLPAMLKREKPKQ